jgi:hypothetical protein
MVQSQAEMSACDFLPSPFLELSYPSNNRRLARGMDIMVGIRGVAPTAFAFAFAAAHH